MSDPTPAPTLNPAPEGQANAARVAKISICLMASVMLASLLLLFGIALLDSITEYQFSEIAFVSLALILMAGNSVLAWLSFFGSKAILSSHRGPAA